MSLKFKGATASRCMHDSLELAATMPSAGFKSMLPEDKNGADFTLLYFPLMAKVCIHALCPVQNRQFNSTECI